DRVRQRLIAASDTVRQRLIAAGISREGLADWLARPDLVRDTSRFLAEFRSRTGKELPRQAPLWQAGEALRLLVLDYLDAHRADLPMTVVQQFRAHFLDNIQRQIRTLRTLYLEHRATELADGMAARAGPGADSAAIREQARTDAAAEVPLAPGNTFGLAE